MLADPLWNDEDGRGEGEGLKKVTECGISGIHLFLHKIEIHAIFHNMHFSKTFEYFQMYGFQNSFVSKHLETNCYPIGCGDPVPFRAPSSDPSCTS